MKRILISGLLILLMPSTHASNEGKTMFETLCMSCHATSGPPTVAPPVFGIKNHVLRAYPKREDFINYIVQWVKQPDASRALMPGAVRRFGVMPALAYPEDQVRKVAEFLYDSNLRMPRWYQQHYEQEHGKPYRDH
ncbi:MAG: c-type cytochrome [Gammaproteobacteria bacterium]|nr:c-type cytochrome [Gammaproteobacteria bacterium]